MGLLLTLVQTISGEGSPTRTIDKYAEDAETLTARLRKHVTTDMSRAKNGILASLGIILNLEHARGYESVAECHAKATRQMIVAGSCPANCFCVGALT